MTLKRLAKESPRSQRRGAELNKAERKRWQNEKSAFKSRHIGKPSQATIVLTPVP
jgi:hypothetical protein